VIIADEIKTPFGVVGSMGPRNSELDGVQIDQQ